MNPNSNMNRKKRRLLPLLLALCVAFAMFPAAAFADDAATPEAEWKSADGAVTETDTLTEILTAHHGDNGTITLLTDATLDKNGGFYEVTGKLTIRSKNSNSPCTIKRGSTSNAKGNAVLVLPSYDTPQKPHLTLENVILDGGAVWDKEENKPLAMDTTNNGTASQSPVVDILQGVVELKGTTTIQNNDISDPYGGRTFFSGGVRVANSGELRLSDKAIITGNRANNENGGGVGLSDNSTLKLSGNAEISGNASFGGSGVSVDGSSELFLSGNARIVNNRVFADTTGFDYRGEGGGVLLDGRMTISGNACVSGNYLGEGNNAPNNVYMDTSDPIEIPGKMNSGALVGVQLPSPQEGNTVAKGMTYSLTSADQKAFFYDNDAFSILKSDHNTLILGNAVAANSLSVSNQSTRVNVPLKLTATLDPPESTTHIEWAIVDAIGTGATLSGSTLTASKTGTVRMSATVKLGNGNTETKEFDVKVTASPSTSGGSSGGYADEFYVVVIPGEHGKAEEPEGFYARDEKHTFTVIPEEGYVIDTVTLDDGSVLSHTDTQFILFVDEPYEVRVTFKKAAAAISPEAPAPSKNPQTGDTATAAPWALLLLGMGGAAAALRLRKASKAK